MRSSYEYDISQIDEALSMAIRWWQRSEGEYRDRYREKINQLLDKRLMLMTLRDMQN